MSSSDANETTPSAVATPAAKPIALQLKHVPTSVSTENLNLIWLKLNIASRFLTAVIVSLLVLLIMSRLANHQDELSHQLLGFSFDITFAASIGVVFAMLYVGNRKVSSERVDTEALGLVDAPKE